MSESRQAQQREKLDVAGSEERQARIGALLSSISTPSPTSAPHPSGLPLPPSRPHALPESSVLARVRDFLPMMASSNEQLLAQRPEDVNMENTEKDEQVIAMDVNLGVFDVNGQPKGDLGPEVELPEQMPGDDDEEDDDDSSDNDSSSESDSSDSEEEGKQTIKEGTAAAKEQK